jgi:chemotaxis protein methyltransferase CheR
LGARSRFILCRNVFIYFENSAIAKVLDKIYHTLKPSGYFLTGHTELSAQNLNLFDKIVFPESIVYQRPSQPKTKQEIIEKKPASVAGASQKAIAPPNQPVISYKKITETNLKKLSGSTLNTNNIVRSEPPKIVSRQPRGSEILIEVENLLSQEKYEIAIAKIQQALKIEPQNVKAYYFLAQIHANLGQYERAIEACHQALKIDDFAISIHYLLAQIAEEQEDLEKAKRILKQIIYLEPNSVSAYLDLSHIYEREGDLKRTKKMQETALNILQQLPPDTKIKERGNITVAELLARF